MAFFACAGSDIIFKGIDNDRNIWFIRFYYIKLKLSENSPTFRQLHINLCILHVY